MMRSEAVQDLTLRLFRMETERDKQKKVGASQISDPCTYHLAKTLSGAPETPTKYWLGGKIGTATHLFIEDTIARADLADFPELEGARIEKKILLGDLEGYGTISSKPDLALVKENHLIDWKTSTRDKSRKFQRTLDDQTYSSKEAEYTLNKYVAQTQLYAWGLNNEGIKIDGISLVFINRDGTTEGDIWNYTFEYSEDLALAVWTRLEQIWQNVQNGVDLETLEKNAHCFKCAIGI